jgi:uncharacterized membrane protein SpoIIM required for sporulation
LEDVLVIHQLTPGRQRSIAAGLLVAGMMLGAIFAPTTATEGRAGRRLVNLRAVEHLPCEPLVIFQRNMTAATILWLGVVTGGVASALSLLIVGGVLSVGAIRFFAEGIPAVVFLSATLPHAVFEITGLVWAGAAGLGGSKIARLMIRKHGGRMSEMWLLLIQAGRGYCVAAMLVAAGALAECFLTPLVYNHVARYVGAVK